jgi:hypothetical protein
LFQSEMVGGKKECLHKFLLEEICRNICAPWVWLSDWFKKSGGTSTIYINPPSNTVVSNHFHSVKILLFSSARSHDFDGM